MAGYNKFESEKYFLETMTRILRNKAEYKVLYINISKLKPKNRHPKFVRVVAKMFDNMVTVTEGTMFVFNNGDIVILGKNITEPLVDEALKKLKNALVTDPIWVNDKDNQFAKIYNSEEFDALTGYVNEMMLGGVDLSSTLETQPIEAGQVEVVKSHLDAINITDLMKHQGVVRLSAPNKFEKLFDEFFVAVKDLSKIFDRNIDLTANEWLFLYLTQTLDRKTMSSFAYSEIKNQGNRISLNLNLSTLFTEEFEKFAQERKDKGQSIVVEVQIMDIINDMQRYFDAKELLHRRGHEVLLDSVGVEIMQALNIEKLGADYIKIFWHPLMEDYNEENSGIKSIIEQIGKEKVILAKTSGEAALRWGIRNGIRSFQGPYIESFETALIRSRCPNVKLCSATECLQRKRLIAGAFREQCAHLDILESGVEIK